MVHRGVGCCPKAETQSQDHTLCLKGCSPCGFRKTGATSFGTDSMGLEGSLRAVVFKLFCKWYSFNPPAYYQIHITYFSTPFIGRKTRKGPLSSCERGLNKHPGFCVARHFPFTSEWTCVRLYTHSYPVSPLEAEMTLYSSFSFPWS